MKVISKVYKGIEYVQLKDLPKEQQENLTKSLDSQFFIKILIEKSIVSNCIQYKDYEFWFDNVYRPAPAPVKLEREVHSPLLNVVAFEKA